MAWTSRLDLALLPPTGRLGGPTARSWDGNCPVSQGGGCTLAGLGTARIESWAETENTADLWASQECLGQREAAWSALAVEHRGRSLRLKPPRKEQCQCLAIILPVKFKLICLCRRDHIVELRASEGDWRTHPALNLRHSVFPGGTLGIDQGMSWTVGPGKRINLVHLQHRGVPSPSPAEVCFWPTLQLSDVKGNGSRLEVCTPAAGFWWYWRLRYLVRAWAEALSSSG